MHAKVIQSEQVLHPVRVRQNQTKLKDERMEGHLENRNLQFGICDTTMTFELGQGQPHRHAQVELIRG